MANGKDEWIQTSSSHIDEASQKIVILMIEDDVRLRYHINGASKELMLQFAIPGIYWRKQGNTFHFLEDGEETSIEAPEVTILRIWT